MKMVMEERFNHWGAFHVYYISLQGLTIWYTTLCEVVFHSCKESIQVKIITTSISFSLTLYTSVDTPLSFPRPLGPFPVPLLGPPFPLPFPLPSLFHTYTSLLHFPSLPPPPTSSPPVRFLGNKAKDFLLSPVGAAVRDTEERKLKHNLLVTAPLHTNV